MVSPAETDVTIAGVEVVMGARSGSGMVANYRCHHEIAWSIGMEQRRSDVSQHQHAGYRRRDGATSEIALRRSEQIVVFAVPETRFEPLGKVRGWLYRREVSEQEKRTADLCIVLRAALTFSRCRCMRTSSIPARVSSTNATC